MSLSGNNVHRWAIMPTLRMILVLYLSQCWLVNLVVTSPTSEPVLRIMNKVGPKVIIVGAGASGIATASKLMQNNITDITILEAMDRTGGRINYHKIGDYGVDMGAHWVHGEQTNVLFKLAAPLGLVRPSGDFNNVLFVRPDGTKLDLDIPFSQFLPQAIGEASSYNETLRSLTFKEVVKRKIEEFGRSKGLSQSDVEGLKISILGGLCTLEGCADLEDVSLKAAIEEEDSDGEWLNEWNIPGGMSNAINLLMGTHEKSPWFGLGVDKKVKLSSRVSEIEWGSGDGVTVTLESGDVITADFLVFTPSVNVLKKKHETIFKPPLPQDKVTAIKAIGMDVVDKVYFYYEEPWWPKGVHGFVLLREQAYNPESKEWGDGIIQFSMENHNPHSVCGWIVGDAARAMEAASDEEVTATVLKVLKHYVGKLYDVKEPDQMLRSKWGSNQDVIGSYSYNSVAADDIDHPRKTLAEPLRTKDGKMVVLIAGEATNTNDNYGTVNGAIETGWREADRLIEYIKNN